MRKVKVRIAWDPKRGSMAIKENDKTNLFDKVMNNNQEPEWNQDYFEEDRCPYCGGTDYSSMKATLVDHKVVIRRFKCIHCPEEWVVIINANGEIEEVMNRKDFGRPKLD